ncbi:hypothetical protein P5673_021473, partial [Acropora cervicornis]
MGKDKQRQSRALRCLEPYNNSPHGRPKDRASGSSGVVHTVHGSSVGSSGRRSKSHGSRSRSSSPAQPPEWAKQLLEQQQANAAELKRLQNELTSSSSKVTRKQRAPDPEFRFAGNKQQYELNRDVMEKIDEALESLDADERSAKLNEGKDLLLQRNKHILLAEKYGWDTVACYTAEPLATDSDDEKRIRKAVKECKQLRDEKKRSATAKHKAKGGVPRQFTERRVFFDRPAATPPVAGKFHSSREVRATCFRCFRQGHFARDCRSAVASCRPDGSGPANSQQSAQLRENIAFWRSIGASQWLLNVLCEGYCLPFVDFPAIKFFPNHKSALCHAEFVSVEISKLLVSGAIVEVLSADLRVCNSLGVAVNSSGKPRLILDLRYVNQHLRSCKFKYED